MEHILRASGVVHAIQETLAGKQTKEELGRWALEVLVKHDNNWLPYNHRDLLEISDAIHNVSFG